MRNILMKQIYGLSEDLNPDLFKSAVHAFSIPSSACPKGS